MKYVLYYDENYYNKDSIEKVVKGQNVLDTEDSVLYLPNTVFLELIPGQLIDSDTIADLTEYVEVV